MTPRSTVPKTATRNAVNENPKYHTAAIQPSATSSSTAGYTIEIGALHPRHRARSASQLRSGTFSYQAISWPHLGQRERGDTTDSSAGQRATHTLRKEPMQLPAANAKTRRIVSVTGESGRGEFRSRR